MIGQRNLVLIHDTQLKATLNSFDIFKANLHVLICDPD